MQNQTEDSQYNVPTENDRERMRYCKSYVYSGEKTKSQRYVLFAALAVFACTPIAALNMADFGTDAMFAVIALALVLGFGYIIKVCQFDNMKELTQYFRDADGEYYKVVITRGASYVVSFDDSYSGDSEMIDDAVVKAQLVAEDKQAAQQMAPAYLAVKRYNAGIRDWDFMNGGTYKVTPLPALTLRRRGLHTDFYTYQKKGTAHILRVPNTYSDLAEDVAAH